METMETVSPETLLKHAKQWLAFTADHTQILAAGQTPQEVESKLQDRQLEDAILHYVPRGGVCL
jgi:predicted Zn-dependent peptidase